MNEKVILVDAYNTFFTDKGVDIDMLELLSSFSERKIVLTNADDDQMVELGINKSPYEVFSLKHKPNKTDGGYFEKMLEHFSLKAEDCVYFEHNVDAVKKATDLGIESFYFNKDIRGYEVLRKNLRNAIFIKSSFKSSFDVFNWSALLLILGAVLSFVLRDYFYFKTIPGMVNISFGALALGSFFLYTIYAAKRESGLRKGRVKMNILYVISICISFSAIALSVKFLAAGLIGVMGFIAGFRLIYQLIRYNYSFNRYE